MSWIPKKVFGGFDSIFHVYLMRKFQKYGRNWILTVHRGAFCQFTFWFITAILVNPPERKLAKRTSVRWLFEGRVKQCINVLPYALNWLRYFAGSSKSHHENSICFIFLESPHQVDIKNLVQILQTLFWVFQYSKNSQWSCLAAHADYFKLLMKGIFDHYVLWPLDKNLIS